MIELEKRRKELKELIINSTKELIEIERALLLSTGIKVGDTYASSKWGSGKIVDIEDCIKLSTVAFIFSQFNKDGSVSKYRHKIYKHDIDSDRTLENDEVLEVIVTITKENVEKFGTGKIEL